MHVAIRPDEDQPAILPLTHATEVQVRLIQDDARRSFGETLTVEEALRVIESGAKPYEFKMVPPEPEADGDDPFRFRRDICFAEIKLQELGYDDATIDLILGDIRRTGSAWCSAHFEESSSYEHAECIEAILDEHRDWNHPRWDRIRVGAAV